MLLVANVKFFLKFGNQNCIDARMFVSIKLWVHLDFRTCVSNPGVMLFVF